MIKELPIDALLLRKGSLIIRAVNNKMRLRMLQLIHRHQKMTVTQIYKQLHLEQAIVSQHLAILRKSGFVSTYRVGRFMYYSVEEKKIREVLRLTEAFLNPPATKGRI